VGHKYSLILSREITAEESAIVQADCAGATFSTASLPTNASVTVTRIDVDDTTSRSLAEAITAGLDAAKQLPDLSIPSLNVPAQPAPGEAGEQASDAAAAAEEKTPTTDDKRTPTTDDEPELVGAGAAS
jgi:hypothetical protein